MNLQEAMVNILAGMYANSDYTNLSTDAKILMAYDAARGILNFERMREKKQDEVKPFIG